ncbi:MAG: DUF6476 family protein [Qingshengfaniella sp.]
MDDAPQENQPEPGNLRFLRLLVTVLTAVMIVGLVTIVVLLVIRLRPAPPAPSVPLPEALTLPDGTRAEAFTRGRDWIAVVTAGDEILIFDLDGTLRQRIALSH